MSEYLNDVIEKLKGKFNAMSAERRERFILATLMLAWAVVIAITPEETLDRIWWAVTGIFSGK